MTIKKVEYKITGDPAGLEGAFQRAELAGLKAFQKIETATAPLTGAFQKVQGMLGVLTGVLAGGAIFKDSVAETVKFSDESRNLSEKLGINATQAGTLNVALGDVHSTAEEFTGLASKLTTQLRTNESGLNALGLATRDHNGEMRNSQDLMLDSLALLNQYKAGTDRNAAAQVLFGKGAGEMNSQLLKLSEEGMAAARIKQEELGLAVGAEGQQAVAAYKAAMNDAGDVLMGVKKVIGEGLLPGLTKMGNWFSDIGPHVVNGFKGAVMGLAIAFETLKYVVSAVWVGIKAFFQSFVVGLNAIVLAFFQWTMGDFSGAKATLNNVWESIKNDMADRNAEMVADAQGSAAKIMAAFEKGTGQAPRDADAPPVAGGTRTFTGGSADKDAGKAALKDSQGDEARALARVEFQRQMAQMDLQQNLITKEQLLQQEIGFEARRYGIQRAALEQRLQLLKDDPSTSVEKKAEIHQQLLTLEQAHVQKTALLQRQAAIEAEADWKQRLDGMANSVTGAFGSMLQGIAKGTASFADTVGTIFSAMVDAAIGDLVRMSQKWISTQIEQLAVKQTTDAADVAGTAATGAAKIPVLAAVAGAGATSGAAPSNPYGALAIGLGVMAGVMAGFAIASAEDGYDIPAGVNPLTQLHEKEMVLPRAQADAVREMAGGVRRAAPPPINVYAMDSQDVLRALLSGGALRKAMRELQRNMTMT